MFWCAPVAFLCTPKLSGKRQVWVGKMSPVTDSLSLPQYRITENFKDG